LLLARDRLGEKPLYYHLAGGSLVFASELKALLRFPQVEARVDPQALDDYLANLRRTPTWSRLVVQYFGESALEILQKQGKIDRFEV